MKTSLKPFEPYLRGLVFVLALVPVAWLIGAALDNGLGANPVEKLSHETGLWALRFLLLTLLMSPLKQLSGWGLWLKLRRMLGLYAFFYAVLHFLIWGLADHQFNGQSIWLDIQERPYIALGFSALVLLLPLALTSTKGMMRRLGKRWKALHRLIYPIAILVIAHFLWLVKADYREVLLYALIVSALLIWRLPVRQLYQRVGASRLSV